MSEGAAAPPRNLRLFVAIELPSAVRDALERAIDGLRRAGAGDAVRWVRPEGLHLTLKFLGATPEDAVGTLNTALRVAVRDTPPLRLQPEHVGSFGGRRGLRVVWVGLTGDVERTKRLATDIEDALERLRIPREERAFNPHLTLARIREEARPEERARIHDVLTGFDTPAFPAFEVTEVNLMQSTLGRGGAVYTRLASYPLEGRP